METKIAQMKSAVDQMKMDVEFLLALEQGLRHGMSYERAVRFAQKKVGA